jgi:hypothetical protein
VELDLCQQPEKPKTLEQYSHYDRVVLGHPFSSIDRDQIIGAYFAWKLGYIDRNADFVATGNIEGSDLDSPGSLVFEGFRQSRVDRYNVKKGNKFHNPLDQEGTAASAFLNAKQDTKNPDWSRLSELRLWLNTRDAGKSDFRPNTLNAKNLNQLDAVFHGLKQEMIDSQDKDLGSYMNRCFDVLDKVLEYGNSGQTIASEQAEVLSRYRAQKSRDRERLVELTADPNFYQYLPESGVAFINCTLLTDPVETGAPGVVRQVTKERHGTEPKVIVVFNNEYDEQSKLTGTKVYLDYNGYDGEPLDDLLSPRLDYLESLFGQGFDVATKKGFGGHKYHVLSSPQFLGTGLDQNAVRYLLEDFFDKPRYTEKSFAEKSTQFVSLLGDIENYATSQISSPDDQWAVPDRVLEVVYTNGDGHLIKIEISESELPLYEKLLTSMPPADRQKWLSQKREFGEPPEVVLEREEIALSQLEKHLSENQPLKVLQDINSINSSSIRKLPLETRLQALDIISQSQASISKVYDIHDTQYRVLIKYLPNWLKDDPAEHLAARYNYESLPRKVDTTLINSICDTVLAQKDHSAQSQVADRLVTILNSDTYRDSHQSTSYDHLLESILEFSIDPRLESSVALRVLAEVNTYITKSPAHARQVSQTYPSLLRRASILNPEVTNTLHGIGVDLENISTDDHVEGVPRSTVSQPDIEKIRARPDHAVTLLVDIGRSTDQDLANLGYYPWGSTEKVAYPGTDGRVIVRGSIDGTRNFDAPDHIQLVARKMVNMICETARQISSPEDKIQIIVSSGPNQQVIDLVAGLTMEYSMDSITAADLLRMTTIKFNMQTNQYEEVPLIRDQEHREMLQNRASKQFLPKN